MTNESKCAASLAEILQFYVFRKNAPDTARALTRSAMTRGEPLLSLGQIHPEVEAEAWRLFQSGGIASPSSSSTSLGKRKDPVKTSKGTAAVQASVQKEDVDHTLDKLVRFLTSDPRQLEKRKQLIRTCSAQGRSFGDGLILHTHVVEDAICRAEQKISTSQATQVVLPLFLLERKLTVGLNGKAVTEAGTKRTNGAVLAGTSRQSVRLGKQLMLTIRNRDGGIPMMIEAQAQP